MCDLTVGCLMRSSLFSYFLGERLFPHTSHPFQTSEYNRHPPQPPSKNNKNKIKWIWSFVFLNFPSQCWYRTLGREKKKKTCNESYSITGYLGNDEPTTTQYRKRGKRDHPSSDRKKKKGFFFLSFLFNKKKSENRLWWWHVDGSQLPVLTL